MAIVHPSQIETSIGRLNQSDYPTASTSGADYRRILNSSQDTAEKTLAFADDQGYDNGSDLASDTWATEAASGVAFNPDLCFQDIGFHMKDALGGYAVSGPDGSLYTHTFTGQSMNTSRQLPARTVLKKYGSIGLYMFPSMVCDSWSISSDRKGRIRTSFHYDGSGYWAKDPSSYTSPAVTSDREWAYAAQGSVYLNRNGQGTSQVETATAAGTITLLGNATVIVTGANISGSPITLSVAVANSDTASAWAAKVRTALRANRAISKEYAVTGATTAIILTDRKKRANDATLNVSLDNGTCTGITTAASSVNTTPGVVGDAQDYSCELESWTLSGTNPVMDGYRICSDFVTAGDPKSGQIKSEALVGARTLTFDFVARMASTDKVEDWMTLGREMTLDVNILGVDTSDASLRITHNKARIIQANPSVGDFINITGQARLLSTSGDIGLTATLVNDVVSYST
jgi:hypothetical protein